MVWAYHNLFTFHLHWTTSEGFFFLLVFGDYKQGPYVKKVLSFIWKKKNKKQKTKKQKTAQEGNYGVVFLLHFIIMYLSL